MTRALRATAIELQPWLAHLSKHVAQARETPDSECVHQVRVAAARLDVALRLGGRRALRDDLRWLRRAASELRDLDVALAREQPSPLREWLEGERALAREQFVRVLHAPRTAALLAALADVPPVTRSRARRCEASLRAQVLARARIAIRPDASIEDLHALRRALRRLRYAREWLGLGTATLKRLLDVFGALNDASTLLEYATHCPRRGEFADWLEDLAAEVRRDAVRAQASWKRARLAQNEGPQ